MEVAQGISFRKAFHFITVAPLQRRLSLRLFVTKTPYGLEQSRASPIDFNCQGGWVGASNGKRNNARAHCEFAVLFLSTATPTAIAPAVLKGLPFLRGILQRMGIKTFAQQAMFCSRGSFLRVKAGIA